MNQKTQDYYLSVHNCYNRLRDEFCRYGKLIMCVDFDDTIYDFHKKGREYNDMIKLIKEYEPYSELIVFTANSEDQYSKIEEYLKEHDIRYKGINCDSSVVTGGRKIYANVYIDDRGGLPLVYAMLKMLIKEIKEGVISYEGV